MQAPSELELQLLPEFKTIGEQSAGNGGCVKRGVRHNALSIARKANTLLHSLLHDEVFCDRWCSVHASSNYSMHPVNEPDELPQS